MQRKVAISPHKFNKSVPVSENCSRNIVPEDFDLADHIWWGIIGLGNIARKMAESLQRLPDAELLAVASRTPGNTEEPR